MKKLIPFAVTLFTALFVAAPAAQAVPYFAADAKTDVCNTIGDVSPETAGSNCESPAGKNVNGIIRFGINLISILAGVIAVLMIILSGFKYITAQGDANQISSAKRTLLYALVGLVLVAISQALVRFVLFKAG